MPHPLRVATTIEIAVAITGWVFGGTIGVYPALRLAIGPLVQLLLLDLQRPPLMTERHGLDHNMQVDAEKHEGPQQDSQEKGQEFADGMDRVSVSKRYHYTDDYIQETE
jgi:hypothetical protein